MGNCKPNSILPYWIHTRIVQMVSDFKVQIKILKMTNPKLESYQYINIPYHIKSLSIVTVTATITTWQYDATLGEQIRQLQMNRLFVGK